MSYEVRVGPDIIWRRHIDQLLDSDTGKPWVFNQQPDPIPEFVPVTSEQMTANVPVPTPTQTPDNIHSKAEQPAVPEPAAGPALEPPTSERGYPPRKRKPPDRLDL